MNIERILAKVPHYSAFYTVDELAEKGRQLCEAHPQIIERMAIGTSRQGEPLWCLKLGNGPKNALCFACPHPNEPIGAMTLITLAQLLAEDPELLAETHMTWYLIPCIDPDGTRLNEGWFKGPFDIESYVRGFYRPGGQQQVEWTFPFDYKGHSWQTPIPETAALMALIDALSPAFVFSLHNCAFGGAYWYLNDSNPALCRELEASARRQGIPLHLGEPESPYITKYAKAVHSMMSMKTYYDWMESRGRAVEPGPMSCGTCSADYIATVCDSLVLMAELPYFLAQGIDDEAPSDITRRQALTAKETRRKVSYAFLKDQWDAVRHLFGADNPFPLLVDGAVELYSGGAAETFDAPEFDRPATRAEVLDSLYISRIFEALDMGLALRACRMEIDRGTADAASLAAFHRAAACIDSELHAQCQALEQGCAYTVGEIRRLVAVQLESALQAIGHC